MITEEVTPLHPRWLDDLLALATARSLTEAAQLRHVTQPAFTRRIQQIERTLGIAVLDRSRRPAQVTADVKRKIDEIRSLTIETRRLAADLRRDGIATHRVTIAAQHTISTGVLARFVAHLSSQSRPPSIRLRSANREDCYTLLMTRQVSMMVAYEADGFPVAANETTLEIRGLGADVLCPIAAPKIIRQIGKTGRKARPLPLVLFPQGRFFGDLFAREVLPDLQAHYHVQVVCETALAPAMLNMAVEGAGVAWLPRKLCASHLVSGAIRELPGTFRRLPLSIVSARRKGLAHTEPLLAVWDELARFAEAGH